MPTPIDKLIDTGPSDAKGLIHEIENESQDDTKIPVDAFEKAKEGNDNVLPLDSKTKELLDKEEKVAEEKDKLEKADEKTGEENTDKSTKEQADTKTDKLDTSEPKDKELTETKDSSDDSLIHLELSITPGQAKLFKKMDKAAREFVISELRTRLGKINELTASNKELAEKAEKGSAPRKGDGSDLPENWYENDAALYITPEYNSISTKLSRVEMLRTHYRNQKIAIAEGENWEDLVPDANGKVTKQLMKPNSAATDHVDNILLDLSKAEGELKDALSAVEHNFKQNHLKTREQVTKLEDQYFPQYKDAKALEKNEYYQSFQKLADKFGLKKDRMIGVTSKMYIFTMENIAKLEAAEAKIKELEAAVAKGGGTTKKSNNGPTGDEINHGGGKKPAGDPDEEQVPLDAFEKYKNRGEM